MWWKRFKRRQRFAYKRNLTYLLFLFILLTMGIGYAVLNTSLSVDGTSGLANARWDIHFDNIQVKEGSVTPTTPATITDDTTVSFAVTLEEPGTFYEFNVDVVNAGTINAMIDTLTIEPVLTQAQQNYLDYIVTYTDGTELAVNHRLDAGTSENLRIAFIYKEGDPSNYPTEDEDITISVSIVYVQANGDAIDVPHPPTLYSVLEDAAAEGTYATQYTGSHHDSFTEEPTKNIYYWYADNDTEGTAILDKNNVLFAGHCWQMIRTTDTGGVKMIYNGEAENNQCLNTRGTHVGYASRTSQNLASAYWYGTDYTYDSTAKTFKVSGTTEQTTWNATTGPGLIGKYTCKLTSEDGSCATLYLVESYYNTTSAYVISINSDSNYSQFGTLQFNQGNRSPTYVGYMNGDAYSSTNLNIISSQNFTTAQTMLQSTSLGISYWYADNISYDSTTGNYSLVNPFQITATTDYPNLVGKYTFGSPNQANTAASVYYIAVVDNSTMYYSQLQNGNLLSAYEPISFGDSITDNGNDTYTINNPISVTLSDWYTNFSNYKNKYTCGDSSTTCTAPRYTTATTSTNYTFLNAGEKIMIGKSRDGLNLTDTILVRKDDLVVNSSNYSEYKYTCNTANGTCSEASLRMITGYTATGYNYVPNRYYGSSVTWNGTNYTLVDPIEMENYNNLSNISTHHFICISVGSKTCSTVAYIHLADSTRFFYISLKNGITSIENIMDDMLTKNTSNSNIKNGIEAWYKHYMLDYDEYVEDTIICNNRSIYELKGWDPNGSIVDDLLQFNEYYFNRNLGCTNTTDKFSINNNSAKLSYKVGLVTSPEMYILKNSNVRKTGQAYWLVSPIAFSNSAIIAYANSNGSLISDYVDSRKGVRPAISLKPGMTYSTGDGRMASPYVVVTS